MPRLPSLAWLRRAYIAVPALQASKNLMVLLERRFWEPADPSLPTNPNEEMWILESTGEVFGEYSDYLKALYLTKSRVWSSVYTGVSNLTYQEALLEDERGRALARKVLSSHACLIAGSTSISIYILKLPSFSCRAVPQGIRGAGIATCSLRYAASRRSHRAYIQRFEAPTASSCTARPGE